MSDDQLSQNEPTAQQPLVQTLSKEGRWLLMAQLVPAVVGIFIGCLALYAALSEADAVRKQQQASIWPHAEMGVNRSNSQDNQSIAIILSNKGIGPARIKSFEVEVDGVSYDNWWAVISVLSSSDRQEFSINNVSVAGKVLLPGETSRLFSIALTHAEARLLPEGETMEMERAYYKQLITDVSNGVSDGKVKIKYCYCSVFDACWSQEFQSNREPEQVETCPARTLGTFL